MVKNICIEPALLTKILVYLYNIVNSEGKKEKRAQASYQISLLHKLCTHDPHDKIIFNDIWNKMTKKLKFPKGLAITKKYKPSGFDAIIHDVTIKLHALKTAEQGAMETAEQGAMEMDKPATAEQEKNELHAMMKQLKGLDVNGKGKSKGGTKKRKKRKRNYKQTRKYIYKKNLLPYK
jgi:hypothetical protein